MTAEDTVVFSFRSIATDFIQIEFTREEAARAMVFPKDRINFFVLATINNIDGTPLVREYQGQNDVSIPELVVATKELFYAVSAVSNIVSSEYKVTPRDALDTIKYAVFSTDTNNPLVLSILNAVSHTAETFVKQQHGAAQSLLRRLSIMSNEMSRAIGSTLENTKRRLNNPFLSISAFPSPYPEEVTVDTTRASDVNNIILDQFPPSAEKQINHLTSPSPYKPVLISEDVNIPETPEALKEIDPINENRELDVIREDNSERNAQRSPVQWEGQAKNISLL